MGSEEWRNHMKHVDPMIIPGVGCVGPFTNITRRELESWLGPHSLLHHCDPRRNTYLHNAVREGAKPFVIKYLLEKILDINTRNRWGETALVIAARDGRDALVKILLKNGADPNIPTIAGYSALTVATDNGHANVAEMLVAHGAKPGR
jgi:ankyrin repeat protein